MKKLFILTKSISKKIPANAFLMLLTGFLFIQVMLLNILHTKHPLGGWVTPIGTYSTTSLLLASLVALSLSLFLLWRSVSVKEKPKKSIANKTSIVKVQNNYSPIDYPRGSTQPVISGFVAG